MAATDSGEPFRLNDDNWIKWHTFIDGKLSLSELDKFLDRPEVKNGVETKLTADEQPKAKRAMKFIRMHLSVKFFKMTEQCTEAHQIWSTLKSHFEKEGKNAKLTGVQKLVRLAKNPLPIEDLALSIRSIVAKVGDLKVNSETFMVGFYTALIPSELSDLRVMSLTSSDEMTLTKAAAVVKNEIELKGEKNLLAAQVERKPTNSTQENKPRHRTRSETKPEPKQQCTYCARTNHTVDKCFFKQRAEKLKVTAVVQKVCGLAERSSRDIWFLDSGSQSHSANQKSGFISIRKDYSIELESAGGDDICVEGVGTCQVHSDLGVTLHLKDCIYAPSLIANFLSCGKLNKHGMDVLLRRDGTVLVFDDEGIVATGQLVDGMYVMNFGEKGTSNIKNIIAATKHKNRSLMDWHKAMGHLNFADLRRFLKKFGVSFKGNDPECKTCLLAKMTRSSHKTKDIESTRPLEKIYTDLSGIIRTPSVGNFRYYLTFVDDFSRFTMVYLLRSKEEVWEKFAEFKAFVENKFEQKIKRLRSDNGTEYTNYRFQQLIKESGIDHSFTEVETPQQNGVAERMNRTIGNGARAVMIDSKIPTRYWPFAVQYVVQMRNASPNAALQHEIPYRLWHGREPEPDHFYSFGTPAVIYNLDATAKMSDPKGIECRLLMQNTEKKGICTHGRV